MDYGIVNIEIVMQWRGDAGFAVASFSNTWQVDSTAPDLFTLKSEVAQAIEAWLPPVLVPISGEASHWQSHYRKKTDAFPYEGLDDGTGLTGGAAGVAPFYQSLMVKKLAGDPPRYKRGRAYLPFIGAAYAGLNFVDPEDGTLSDAAAAFAAPATFGGTVLLPVVRQGFFPVWEYVQSAVMSPFMAFQRRRQASGRYYDNP